MATTDIQIVTVTNPFDRRQRRFDATAYTGQTLRELHDRFVPSGLPVTMSINGIPVEQSLWASTVPKVGDRIVVMPVVEGGDDAKQILGAVAMIAAAAARLSVRLCPLRKWNRRKAVTHLRYTAGVRQRYKRRVSLYPGSTARTAYTETLSMQIRVIRDSQKKPRLKPLRQSFVYVMDRLSQSATYK